MESILKNVYKDIYMSYTKRKGVFSMEYIEKTTDMEIFEIMYDIAMDILREYNANSFYDLPVYEKLIKFFGWESADLFLYNVYRID